MIPVIPRTPQDIDSPSMRLMVAKIGSEYPPQFVKCAPEANAPFNDCHRIVEKRVETEGGEQIFGWIIWENSSQFIEAMFHSVWISPDGETMDITPQKLMENEVIFIPDRRLTWTGVMVPNQRIALTRDKETLFSLKFAECKERLRIQFDSASQNTSIDIPLDVVLREVKKITPHAFPCLCGSGLRFRKCCENLPESVAVKRCGPYLKHLMEIS